MDRYLAIALCSSACLLCATLSVTACTGSDASSGPAGGGATGTGGNGDGTGGSDILDVDAGDTDPCLGPNPPPECALVASRPACGDGTLDDGACEDGASPGNGCQEGCDDGNSLPGDGCTGACAVEPYWECPTAGEPCVSLIVCGDGERGPGEMCDDGNALDGDGCSAGCNAVEPGWSCPTPGQPCDLLEVCGDGRVTGNEFCDDGNTLPQDGCTSTCQWEAGFACEGDAPNYRCSLTTCGDGVRGNAEGCDDGNQEPGDGCSALCENEPNCTSAGCTTTCGDGLLLPNGTEACDDGNRREGDGCSPDCTPEDGFTCQQGQMGTHMDVPVVYRDFTNSHPDFERAPPDGSDGIIAGIVATDTDQDGKPVLGSTVPVNAQITSATTFAEWFRNGPSAITYPTTLRLTAQGDVYMFESGTFFPMDQRGWVELGQESPLAALRPPPYGNWEDAGLHNFYFTSEVRFWFQYTGNHSLSFLGDDDVWVFVNRKLAVDVGGVHSPMEGSVIIDASTASQFGLVEGTVYEIVVFHAERHTTASSYHLELSGFNTAASECVSDCGDGIVAANEICDNGPANDDTAYGGCRRDCTPGPYCGDGVTTPEFEQCDDGENLGTYGGCAPGCVFGPHCGDGLTEPGIEQCDDGIFSGLYGQCAPGCVLGPYCGDGVKNEPYEDCDDGNNLDHDGCSAACASEVYVE